MLDIYLPIAEVFINVPLLLLISATVGFLTGLLGIGGGFLMTPILIFLGIPPVYAVANGANNILAASVSGSLAHYFKNQIDVKMGILILIGGLMGAILGVEIFRYFIKEGSFLLPRIGTGARKGLSVSISNLSLSIVLNVS